jgi:pimeloyl-ACP methyl ester carboxylesterase
MRTTLEAGTLLDKRYEIIKLLGQGDPEAARQLVQDIPNVRVEVLDTGHLIAAEQPGAVNALILTFFEEP